MTITVAIEELEQVLKRTSDTYIIARLKCIIEDLSDYMKAHGEEYVINESIAKLIENKGSSLERVNRSWVKELYQYVLSMSKTGQSGEYTTIKELDDLRVLQEDALSEYDTTITGCMDYQSKKTSKKMAVFKYGVIALIVVAIVFTLLSFFEPFQEWGTIVGAIIGALDFCFGLGFQIYERKDDIAQKTRTQTAQSTLQEKQRQIEAKKQAVNFSIVQKATYMININETSSGDGATQTVNVTTAKN